MTDVGFSEKLKQILSQASALTAGYLRLARTDGVLKLHARVSRTSWWGG